MELQGNARPYSTEVDCMRDPREYERPICAEVGPDLFYPEDIEGNGKFELVDKARRICQGCSHITECAEWGIYNERYGIWGGLTAYQRRIIRRRRNIQVRKEDIA
jgi:predicted Fe-S protein YdhL (DUF1289 family)